MLVHLQMNTIRICKFRKCINTTKPSSEDSHVSSYHGSSTRVLLSDSLTSSNIQWTSKDFLDDLKQYKTIDSIISAPSVCPCTICNYDLSSTGIRDERRDFNNGTPRLLFTFRQQFGQYQGPLHSEFATFHSRLRTFPFETEAKDENISTQAESGFYFTGMRKKTMLILKNPLIA